MAHTAPVGARSSATTSSRTKIGQGYDGARSLPAQREHRTLSPTDQLRHKGRRTAKDLQVALRGNAKAHQCRATTGELFRRSGELTWPSNRLALRFQLVT